MKVHQDSRSQNANLRFLSKPFSPITEIRTASPPRQIQILSKFWIRLLLFFCRLWDFGRETVDMSRKISLMSLTLRNRLIWNIELVEWIAWQLE